MEDEKIRESVAVETFVEMCKQIQLFPARDNTSEKVPTPRKLREYRKNRKKKRKLVAKLKRSN